MARASAHHRGGGQAPAVEQRARRLRPAICVPSRLRIVDALRGAPRTVAELAAAAGLTSQATSQHLRVLREAGLVRRAAREGTSVRYELPTDPDSRHLHDMLALLERSA
jgi:DNA-binding transcriptional ArsR family regulator